jgi:hypothetical protein
MTSLVDNAEDDVPTDLERLQHALSAADPRAFLVSRRVIRRVIRYSDGLDLLGLSLPSHRALLLDPVRARDWIDPAELFAPVPQDDEQPIILLPRPEARDLARSSFDDLLVAIWRLLFHSRVRLALKSIHERGQLSEESIRRRIDRIGRIEFEEIRVVLQREALLDNPRDEIAAFIEFAALFLELHRFAPEQIVVYFPSLESSERISAILNEVDDVDAIFHATRPEGTPKVPRLQAALDPLSFDGPTRESVYEDSVPSPSGRYGRMTRRAEKALADGNFVRAAILRTRLEHRGPGNLRKRNRDEASRAIQRLCDHLREVFALDNTRAAAWAETLPRLVERASLGIWPNEARLLYDLQKVAIDYRREVYAVDVIEWARSFGRRPIIRQLPNQRQVLIVRHLRAAARRVAGTRLSVPVKLHLADLIAEALQHQESQLRERFRPLIARTLDRTNWIPANLPERVALNKLVEELLDLIVEHGYLAIGDLRDAVSRNQLKLEDLQGPKEFFSGDRLLKTDRKLSYALDGVYRRGEFYLRLLQRFSSLLFGTPIGRLFILFLGLPLGAAYVALEGTQHILRLFPPGSAPHQLRLVNDATLIATTLFLVGMINSSRFRERALRMARLISRVFRTALIDGPRYLRNLPLVRRIVDSKTFDQVWRWFIKPFVFAIGTFLVLRQSRIDEFSSALISGTIFLVLVPLLNSRIARDLEEFVAEHASGTWRWLRSDFLPGLYRTIMDGFRQTVENLERVLYTIDEWLRFKGGQGSTTLVLKATTGIVWFYATYVVRFAVNLVIEPQLNPIKHFPVVTVSHKIVAGFLFSVPGYLMASPLGMQRAMANLVALILQFIVPGIFGFLVWEFKENWRLYAANRSKTLTPRIIGSHGETMLRLLQPGIHSGTIPKLYARLRRADDPSRSTRDGRKIQKVRDALHHVSEDLHKFFDRELLVLLAHSARTPDLKLGKISIGPNLVRVSIDRADGAGGALVLNFIDQCGWLVSEVGAEGWVAELNDDARAAVRNALAGLYKWAGSMIVREQIVEILGTRVPDATVRLSGEGLFLTWPGCVAPHLIDLTETTDPENARFLFGSCPITWNEWVAAWETSREPSRLLPDIRLLPDEIDPPQILPLDAESATPVRL